MDQKELELLEKYSVADKELEHLWNEHKKFKAQLEELEAKHFLSEEEEVQVRELKKKKLEVKTILVAKLDKMKK